MLSIIFLRFIHFPINFIFKIYIVTEMMLVFIKTNFHFIIHLSTLPVHSTSRIFGCIILYLLISPILKIFVLLFLVSHLYIHHSSIKPSFSIHLHLLNNNYWASSIPLQFLPTNTTYQSYHLPSLVSYC